MREVKPLSLIYEIPDSLPEDICREMIRRFEASQDQQYAGRIGQASTEETSIKKTTDLRISGRDDWKDIDAILMQSLSKHFSAIAQMFPFFAANRFKDLGYNLQRYREGEYYHWHVDGGPGEFSQRQLVAIWYLNNVPGPGGETEFPLQEILVKPEAGKLVLFPPFWTHPHRAVTV
ncbi:MAG: 2OG-Fe(II) oxygenase [Pseudomonadota bacterium]